MKYLETKHEKNSAVITTLIVVILVLLCFVVGQSYQDPPEEYGVAINFGNSSVGNGDIQPDKPVKSLDLNSNKQPQEAQVEPNNTQTTSTAAKEDVLTQETEDAIAIKKAEAVKKGNAVAEDNANKEVAKKAKEIADADAAKKAEEAKKKAEIDALMGGMNNTDGDTNGGEGNDNKSGDKGQLDGNPYAPSYFGNAGSGNGGIGYGLNGRGKPNFEKTAQKCNESGLVVIKIEVDRSGKVVKAERSKGTVNTADCLIEPALKIAKSHKWKADPKAPIRQIGFVSIDFKIGQ